MAHTASTGGLAPPVSTVYATTVFCRSCLRFWTAKFVHEEAGRSPQPIADPSKPRRCHQPVGHSDVRGA